MGMNARKCGHDSCTHGSFTKRYILRTTTTIELLLIVLIEINYAKKNRSMITHFKLINRMPSDNSFNTGF